MMWRTIQALQYLITLIQQPLCLLGTSQGPDRSTLMVNVGKHCVANYVHLIIVKIYNQIEDTVLRICLLDRAYTVLQDINSVQKLCIRRKLLQ